jgi:hypothetical protein
VEELIVNPRVPFLAPVVMDVNVNIDIPPLVPIYQRYDIADPVPVQDAAFVEPIEAEAELAVETIPAEAELAVETIPAEAELAVETIPAEAELPIETIPMEAANMVEPVPVEAADIIEPVRVELTERQRIADACREAAQVRMRAIEQNLASERGLPALRILAAGRAIAPGQAIIPVAPYPIIPGRAIILDNVNREIGGQAVLDLVNIQGNVAALEHRDVGRNAVILQPHVEGGLAALEPRIGRVAALQPRNVRRRAAAPEHRNVPGDAVEARNVLGRAVRGRPRGRPLGTTAAVMAARRLGLNIQPPVPRVQQPENVPIPGPDSEEDPDPDVVYTPDQIREIIRNRAARAEALHAVAFLEPPLEVLLLSDDESEEEPHVPQVHEPEENGPILANVSCIICQTRRSNGSTECGHLYCHNCYDVYWKNKREMWNRLNVRFDKKKVGCAQCRRKMGQFRVVHLHGI